MKVEIRAQFNGRVLEPDDSCSVSLSGDLNGWYVGLLRSRFGGPQPHTDVKVFAESAAPYADWAAHNNIEFPDIYLITWLERWVGAQYGTTSVDLVENICRIGVQYCNTFYRSPDSIALLIKRVVMSSWAYPLMANDDDYQEISGQHGPARQKLFVLKSRIT